VIRQTDVLIVGAGPTGLVLALWLTRLGVRLRIVDQLPEPATTTRAVAVQARTLEFYRQIGIADALVARGRTVTQVNLWVAGRHVARAAFGNIGAGLSPYPYVLIFSQDAHGTLVDRSTQGRRRRRRTPDGVDCAPQQPSHHGRLLPLDRLSVRRTRQRGPL
jgi:2-polyprenyl-6-methoxyphenol hydroxylase-like FAD-dependent oxidoreductase